MLRAVLLDVDFTLFRPGPELGPEGYVRFGSRHGLVLDPDLYETARLAAIADLDQHPELEHDEEIWVRFTRDIVEGMGGVGDAADPCARAIVREWERHENFFLYDDALPAIAELRRHNLRLGLISNGQRDLDEFATSSPTVRSSRLHSRRSTSALTRRQWSATRRATTSRAHARSGFAGSSSTARAFTCRDQTSSPRSSHSPPHSA